MVAPEIRQRELELLKRWRDTGDQMALNDLMNSYRPVINSWVYKLSQGVPQVDRAILDGIVKKSIVESFRRYDFDRGVQLNTFVMSRLPETYREIYPLQNVAKIPTHRVTQIQTFQHAFQDLAEDYGREPTVSELQDELGWDRKEIRRMNMELRRDLSEGVGDIEPTFSDPRISFAFDTVYMGLQPKEKLMAEYFMGMAGKPRITNLDIISRKTGVPVRDVRKFKQRLIKDLRTF